MKSSMDQQQRDLILVSEIAGFLHDLGKLHPGFARENLVSKGNLSSQSRELNHISAAHGAILEPKRLYPDANELTLHPEWQNVLDRLLNDPAWHALLHIPAEWCHPETRQALGLGAPLRQHHAVSGFPEDQQTLFGDVYTVGADIRDSALDKGSGECGDAKQTEQKAFISNGLGFESQKYDSETLRGAWANAIAILNGVFDESKLNIDVLQVRNRIYSDLNAHFKNALGETRRPTNDVSLYHHAFSAASHFKAAMAEGVLRQDFKTWQGKDGLFNWQALGRIRFRLLGIRWNWAEIVRGALRPVVWASLSAARRQAEQKLQALIEDRYPIGNVIYIDDDGILILAPGFYEGLGDDAAQRSEDLFARFILDVLQPEISNCLNPLGCGVDFHLYWSEPTLYLTDYAEALGISPHPSRQRFGQVDLPGLQQRWRNALGKQMHICPQCGLRPASTREMALDESALGEQDLCAVCADFSNDEAFKARKFNAKQLFGVEPTSFNLQKISQCRNGSENGRMVLISVQIDTSSIASGEALVTQLSRPIGKIDANNKKKWNSNDLGNAFNQILIALKNNDQKNFDGLDSKFIANMKQWIGDDYWLKDTDGRSLEKGKFAQALDVANSFFLREAVPEGLGLCRHDGDRLALFAQRKHASPARLQRLWDDLEALWRELFQEIAEKSNNQFIPLSLDARGLRFLVSAKDASEVLLSIQSILLTCFSKVRGGLSVHVSALAMRAKFPMYVAMNAIYRMERRIMHKRRQIWTVKHCERPPNTQFFNIHWQTPQGEVHWQIDLTTGDSKKDDIWHPHVICLSRDEGPNRIVHVSELQVGDKVSVPVSTFDFMTLEGSARRFDIHYDEQGCRPHLVLGQPGRAPHLLEQLPEIVDPEGNWVALTAWNSSQLKGLYGLFVETYDNWGRFAANDELKETGRIAWKNHLADILGRYLAGSTRAQLRDDLLSAIEDGRFFDAVEWNTYICESPSASIDMADTSTQE